MKEVIYFFGRFENIKGNWILDENAWKALSVYSEDNWEIKAAVPVTKWGKTVGIHYTLQREKKE